MNSHTLAEILLRLEDFPVVLSSQANSNNAKLLNNIYLFQHSNSPFEYALVFSNSSLSDEIEIAL